MPLDAIEVLSQLGRLTEPSMQRLVATMRGSDAAAVSVPAPDPRVCWNDIHESAGSILRQMHMSRAGHTHATFACVELVQTLQKTRPTDSAAVSAAVDGWFVELRTNSNIAQSLHVAFLAWALMVAAVTLAMQEFVMTLDERMEDAARDRILACNTHSEEREVLRGPTEQADRFVTAARRPIFFGWHMGRACSDPNGCAQVDRQLMERVPVVAKVIADVVSLDLDSCAAWTVEAVAQTWGSQGQIQTRCDGKKKKVETKSGGGGIAAESTTGKDKGKGKSKHKHKSKHRQADGNGVITVSGHGTAFLSTVLEMRLFEGALQAVWTKHVVEQRAMNVLRSMLRIWGPDGNENAENDMLADTLGGPFAVPDPTLPRKTGVATSIGNGEKSSKPDDAEDDRPDLPFADECDPSANAIYEDDAVPMEGFNHYGSNIEIPFEGLRQTETNSVDEIYAMITDLKQKASLAAPGVGTAG